MIEIKSDKGKTEVSTEGTLIEVIVDTVCSISAIRDGIKDKGMKDTFTNTLFLFMLSDGFDKVDAIQQNDKAKTAKDFLNEYYPPEPNYENEIYDIGIIPRQTGLAERFMFPFSQLNFLLNGGKFDRVTLITSSTDNGKSTIASQILCSVIKQGYKACAFFGEDTAYESQDRIFKQFSRAEDMVYVPYKVNDKNTNCGEWILSESAYQSAQEQFSGKLFLYNTNASTKVEEILDGFEQARTENGCRVFLLDNCEMFDIDTDNENKAMKDNILQIREYAINYKVHIILISHIRKLENGKILPNLDDVKGTSSIVNISKTF